LRQIAYIGSVCVELSLPVWPVQVRMKKIGTQKERNEEKAQIVHISCRCASATTSGRISAKLDKSVFGADKVLKFPCWHREARQSFHSVMRYRAAGDHEQRARSAHDTSVSPHETKFYV